MLGRMVRFISQRELRNENAKVMDAVAGGETFIVTRNGEPVAEIRPIQSVSSPATGSRWPRFVPFSLFGRPSSDARTCRATLACGSGSTRTNFVATSITPSISACRWRQDCSTPRW